MGKAYQFKIVIENSKPLVWRRILVPAFINFGQLHGIIQVAFGWEDDHLHEFVFPSINVRIPGSVPFGNDSMYENIRIKELVSFVKWFRYIYDFGDNWVHKIMIEKLVDDYNYAYPQVIKFKGDNFEEDSGGVFGNWEDELDDYIEKAEIGEFSIENVNSRLQQKCFFKGERKALIKNIEEIGEIGFKDLNVIMEPVVKEDRIYPNDPCPCGSGKKYKKCCGNTR